MKVAIFTAFFSQETMTYVKSVIQYLEKKKHELILVDRLKKYLGGDSFNYFDDDKALTGVDFLFSIG